MSYELHVQRERVPCSRCGAAASLETCEYVHDAAGVPLWRTVRRHQRCDACSSWLRVPVSRAERRAYPRTPGVWPRIAVSWAIFAGYWVGLFASRAIEKSDRGSVLLGGSL